MDKEDFYAVLKLVSGEEIFAKVQPCEEEDKTILLLDSPVTFENIIIRQIGVSAVRINPWIKMSDDPVLVMNMDKVITMSESNDMEIILMYQNFVRHAKQEMGNEEPLNRKMGYISNVNDAKELLEKLYKLNKPKKPNT